MLRFVLPVLLVFMATVLPAQKTSLRGSVGDSVENTIPVKAVVALLNPQDTTLSHFTRVNSAGRFAFHDLPGTEYLLMVTYPGYANYAEKISMTPLVDNRLNTIYLYHPSQVLNEIVLKQSDFRLKSDTLELNIRSAKIGPNATVEDLLKQLPGIFVDRQGNITAFGQKIEKFFVDGEEFFSDDPTISIRNLRADAVKKVQVFDKSGEQAEITGTIDGKVIKSMNIELRDDSKKGYFGLAEAGGSLNHYHGRGLINAFKAKRKLSAFALTGNTEENGFTDKEADSYGFNNKRITVDEGSGTVFRSSGEDSDYDVENYQGEGLPQSVRAGIHYSNRLPAVATSNNLLFNHLKIRNESNVIRQNILPDSVYYSFDESRSHTSNSFFGFKSKWTATPDSTSKIVIDAIAGGGQKDGVISKLGQTTTASLDTLIKNSRNSNYTGDHLDYRAKATYLKNWKARSLSLQLMQGVSRENNVNLFGYEQQYGRNNIDRSRLHEQKKKRDYLNRQFRAGAFFTQKVSAKSKLELNYSYFSLFGDEDKTALAKNGDGKYDRIIDSLSNHFKYRYQIQAAGLILHSNLPNAELAFGGRLAKIDYQPKNKGNEPGEGSINYAFLPAVDFAYYINENRYLKLGLSGEARQPQVNQLNPVVLIDDPANIFEGNPDLKIETAYTLQADFTNYQMAKERYLFLTSSFTYTKDQLALNYSTDALGQKITRYGNHDGFEGLIAGAYNFKVNRVRLGVGPAFTYLNFTNFINDRKNTSDSYIAALRLNAGFTSNAFSVNGQVAPEYHRSMFTISSPNHISYRNLKVAVYSTLFLPFKMEFGNDILVNLKQKMRGFDQNNSVVLLNAYLEKRFLKNESLAVRLSVNDILDQNKGYTRELFSIYTEERNYLAFRRYALLKVTYHFRKGKKQDADQMIEL